jgi:hypothetical protein
MHITALAGGIGGARFVRGLLAHLATAAPGSEVTVIGNTADDITLFGLRVCPDLDTVMYTLGGGISEERGWGREGETFVVKEELARTASSRRGSVSATVTSRPTSYARRCSARATPCPPSRRRCAPGGDCATRVCACCR